MAIQFTDTTGDAVKKAQKDTGIQFTDATAPTKEEKLRAEIEPLAAEAAKESAKAAGSRFLEAGKELAQPIADLGQQFVDRPSEIATLGIPLAETAASFGTGVGAMAAGGIAGLAELRPEVSTPGILGISDVPAQAMKPPVAEPVDKLTAATDTIHRVMEDFTYQPGTKTGQILTEIGALPFAAAKEYGAFLGDGILERGGNPNVAAVVAALPEVFLVISGHAKGKKGPGGKPLTKREVTIDKRRKELIVEEVKQVVDTVKKETDIDPEALLGIKIDEVVKLEPVEVQALLEKAKMREAVVEEAPIELVEPVVPPVVKPPASTMEVTVGGKKLTTPEVEALLAERRKPKSAGLPEKLPQAKVKPVKPKAEKPKVEKPIPLTEKLPQAKVVKEPVKPKPTKRATAAEARKIAAEEKVKIRERAFQKRRLVQEERRRVQSEEGIEFTELKRRAPKIHAIAKQFKELKDKPKINDREFDLVIQKMYTTKPEFRAGLKNLTENIIELERFREKNFKPREYTKRNAALEIDKGVKEKVFTPKQGEVMKVIADALKKNPDVTWTKSTINGFNNLTKDIQLKDADSAIHELGHWAFKDVLTTKERIKFMEGMERFYKGDKKLDDLLTIKSRQTIKVGESATKEWISNHSTNFNEYFAEQFSQYVKYDVLTEPQYRTIMDKVIDFIKEIHDKARGKNVFDKELLQFFEKIIDKEKVQKTKPDVGIPVDDFISMLKNAAKKEKVKDRQKLADARLLEELDNDLLLRDPEISLDAVIDSYQQAGARPDYQAILDKMREGWKKNGLDIDVGAKAAERAPKELKGYTKPEVEHYNSVIHDAMSKGLSFEEVYQKKGVSEKVAADLTIQAERYADQIKKEYEKVHGPQVNKVWKNEKRGIYNKPTYRKDIETLATVKPTDFKAGATDFALTPDSFFDKLGANVREVIQGPVRDAQAAFDHEFQNATKRLAEVKSIVKRKDRKKLDNWTFVQQRNGKAYLEAIGEKIPEWDDLSPEAQVAYTYMRNEYKNYYNRLNAMRRMNGMAPFKETKNYFTFMGDLSTMEFNGYGSVLMDAGKFNKGQAALNSTPFKYNKKRRQINLEDGTVIKMEHDSFNRFELYQRSALRHAHLTPALTGINSNIRQIISLPRKVRAGDLASKTVQADIASGKLKPDQIIDHPSKFRFDQRNNDAASFIQGYANATALGRERRIGEGGIGTPVADNVVNSVLQTVNENLTHSLLAGSIRLAILQPSALTNTAAITARHLPSAIVKSFHKPTVRDAINKSRVLRGRVLDAHIGDLSDALFTAGSFAGKTKATQRAVSRATLSLTRAIDGKIATMSWIAFYDKAKAEGLTNHEAVRYADTTVVKTQSSGLIQDRAKIQQSVLGKSISLFQTFTISQYNLLRYDIVEGGGKKTTSEIWVPEPKLRKELQAEQASLRDMAKEIGINHRRIKPADSVKMAVTFMAASMIANSLYEDVIGINSPNPTPLRTAKRLYDEGEDLDQVVLKSVVDASGYLPLMGGLAYGRGPAGATYEAITKLLTAPDIGQLGSATLTLLGIPGLTTARIAAKAYEEEEENPIFYILRRKRD